MNHKATILVIDDEPRNVRLFEAALASAGYTVLTASSGDEGLRILKTQSPDLILLDINMPEMSGITFYEKISDQYGHPRFPVFILTARDNVKEMFDRLFIDGFMLKPVDVGELLRQVGLIIEKRRDPYRSSVRSKQHRKVMVVENDPRVSDTLVPDLIKRGHTVSLVSSGLDALEQVCSQSHDLMLVNLRLPDISGDVLAAKVKRMARTTDIDAIVYLPFDGKFDLSIINQMCQKIGIPNVVDAASPNELLGKLNEIIHGADN